MTAMENPAGLSVPVPAPKAKRSPGAWKFIGTSLWGLAISAAMFGGEFAAVAATGIYVALRGEALDLEQMSILVRSGLTISLSVMMGLPAVLGVLWIAIRLSRIGFADYLAL